MVFGVPLIFALFTVQHTSREKKYAKMSYHLVSNIYTKYPFDVTSITYYMCTNITFIWVHIAILYPPEN